MAKNKLACAVGITIATYAATGALGVVAVAQEDLTDPLRQMMSDGKAYLDLRYRYERVDQEGFGRDANASTLRSRLGFSSGVMNGLSFQVEFDNITSIGSEKYNSTENGNSQYPVVADPTGTDLNQALLKYSGDVFGGTYGRQRIVHANQRFIGGVAWRQNEQTYDGFRATVKPVAALNIDYSYVYNVKRIFGPDDGANPANLHGNNHFILADYTIADNHKIAGYGYLLDFDTNSSYPSGKTQDNSSDTWGVEYKGKISIVELHAAWATQRDAGGNTRSYDADYYAADVGINLDVLTLQGGVEVLGAGDGVGFSTPLATLHKFQGWADMFLDTPGDGIEDIFVGASGKLGPVKLQAVYHDFSAEDSNADFGSEWDLVATWAVTKQLTTQVHFADFSSDSERYPDTTKGWVTLQLKL